MKIPKEFELLGQKIKVKYRKTLIDKEEAYGIWIHDENTILLQQSTTKYPLSEDQIMQTFFHELLHACCDLAGYDKISSDERFINSVASILHQFIKQL